MCNDRCLVCGAEVEPYLSLDLDGEEEPMNVLPPAPAPDTRVSIGPTDV
jgi:hypothetical protein